MEIYDTAREKHTPKKPELPKTGKDGEKNRDEKCGNGNALRRKKET
jgi:hypothetical protein